MLYALVLNHTDTEYGELPPGIHVGVPDAVKAPEDPFNDSPPPNLPADV